MIVVARRARSLTVASSMSPKFHDGDSVRITDGINNAQVGVVIDQVVSGGELLYLVQRGDARSWVAEEHIEIVEEETP